MPKPFSREEMGQSSRVQDGRYYTDFVEFCLAQAAAQVKQLDCGSTLAPIVRLPDWRKLESWNKEIYQDQPS